MGDDDNNSAGGNKRYRQIHKLIKAYTEEELLLL